MIETALVLPLFFALLFGCFQIALLYTSYIELADVVNTAARYASVNPTNLSGAASAPIGSIQGQLQSLGKSPLTGAALVVNDNSHISIQYLAAGSGSPCFTYDQTVPAVLPSTVTCAKAGTIIHIQVTSTYQINAASLLFPTAVYTITTSPQASVVEEN